MARLTGGELPGSRTARARSAFYPGAGFCTIIGIGTFVTATPGHVTPWTRCYRCSRPSTISTMMTSFRIDSLDFPSPGIFVSATRECEMVTFQENISRSRRTVDRSAGSSISSRHRLFFRRSPTFRVFINGILRPKTFNNFVNCFYSECRIVGRRKWSDTERLSRFPLFFPPTPGSTVIGITAIAALILQKLMCHLSDESIVGFPRHFTLTLCIFAKIQIIN